MWRKHPKLPIEVSTAGQVRGERQRSGSISANGYRRMKIEGKVYYLQSLVLETFVGPRPKGKQARFIDGNNGNCQLSNLEWGEPVWASKKVAPLAMTRGRIAQQLGVPMAVAKGLMSLYTYSATPQQVAVKFGISVERATRYLEVTEKELSR